MRAPLTGLTRTRLGSGFAETFGTAAATGSGGMAAQGDCCAWQQKPLTIRSARMILHLFNLLFFVPGRAPSPPPRGVRGVVCAGTRLATCSTAWLLALRWPPCSTGGRCEWHDTVLPPTGAVLFGIGVSLVRAEASAGLDASVALPWTVSRSTDERERAACGRVPGWSCALTCAACSLSWPLALLTRMLWPIHPLISCVPANIHNHISCQVLACGVLLIALSILGAVATSTQRPVSVIAFCPARRVREACL